MKKNYYLLLLSAFLFQSCATLLRNDQAERVTFAPAQANTLIFVNGEFKGLSPVTMPISNDTVYNVKYINRNFMSKSFKMQSQIIKKWMWLDIACLPVTAFVPLLVDHTTGAWKGFDDRAFPSTLVRWSDIKDPHDYLDEIFQIENLYFETGESTIKPEGYDNLNKLAGILKTYDDVQLDIHGHTDITGDADNNLQLSKDRSIAVKRYLESQGVSESRMKADGHGQAIPLINGQTEEAFQYNRRVEFTFYVNK